MTSDFARQTSPAFGRAIISFFTRPGGSRRVFALAEVVSDPEHDSGFNPSIEESCQWKLRVRYEILPVSSGVLIDQVSSHRDLAKSLSQKSHIRLLPEESESANSKLRDAKQ